MSATQRADRGNDWYVSFRYGRRRVRRRSPLQTRKGAEAFERALRRRFVEQEERGIDPFHERTLTFAELAGHWMTAHVEVKNRLSTRRAKDLALRAHLLPMLANRLVHEIRPTDVDRVIRSMHDKRLSPKTINNVLSMLRSCLWWGRQRGCLDRMPEIVALRAPEPSFTYLSVNEARRLLAATPSPYWRTLVLFFLHTGVRVGEAAGVRWSDLVLEGPSPRVRIQRTVSLGVVGPTKNGRAREIPLSSELVASLRPLPRISEHVFALPDGSLLRSAQSAKYLYRFCRRAGIKRISWHVLRHTFATELSERGASIRVIQELLGHASILMTCRYAHVTGRALRNAVAGLPEMAPTTPDGADSGVWSIRSEPDTVRTHETATRPHPQLQRHQDA